MAHDASLIHHYSHGQLLDAIAAGLTQLGKTPETATIDDLAPVDEFHIGGRQATVDLIDQLGLSPGQHVLDIGCGLGGTARFIARSIGCKVSGIDLTPEYIEVGNDLSAWVGLSSLVDLRPGDAIDMDFEPESFDAVIMLHVGMNIAEKRSLFIEVEKLLRPGGIFGVYDIMRTNEEPLLFPVPWATEPHMSVLGSPEDYQREITDSGFEIINMRNRRDFAREFFAAMQKRIASSDGPPPLGLHILFGDGAAVKIGNMLENLAAGRVAPVEVIAKKSP